MITCYKRELSLPPQQTDSKAKIPGAYSEEFYGVEKLANDLPACPSLHPNNQIKILTTLIAFYNFVIICPAVCIYA